MGQDIDEDNPVASRNRRSPGGVRVVMDSDEVIDREVLLAAGLDPDDPQVWAVQYRVRDLLICLGILRASQIDPHA